jgi:hypothetical protein
VVGENALKESNLRTLSRDRAAPREQHQHAQTRHNSSESAVPKIWRPRERAPILQ